MGRIVYHIHLRSGILEDLADLNTASGVAAAYIMQHLAEGLLRVLLLERNDFAAIRCTILGSCGMGIGNIFGDHVHTQSLCCQSGCRNIKC